MKGSGNASHRTARKTAKCMWATSEHELSTFGDGFKARPAARGLFFMEVLQTFSYLYVYIYIYTYVCVCVCIYIYIWYPPKIKMLVSGVDLTSPRAQPRYAG